MMFQLYSMETLIYIGLGFGILIITIIIVTCLVDPCCLCYKWIRKQGNKDKSGVAKAITLTEGVFKNGYEMFPPDSLGKQGGALFSNTSIKRDSCYSSMSDTSEGIISNIQLCSKSFSASGTNHLQFNCQAPSIDLCGEVTLKFLYLTNENQQAGKIFITVQEARNLQPREYLSPTVNSYIEVMAFPTKSVYTAALEERQSPDQKRTFSFRTRTVRGNISPYFDEKFLAAVDVKNSDIKSWHIKIKAYDDDKYGNPTELGCSDFPLKSAMDRNCQEIIYKCCLKQPNRNLGNMLLSINHLPTAERLVFHILRVSNVHKDVEFSTSFNLQVHVLLLSGMGRILKRRKTSFGHGESGQVFEETIPFHVQSSQLTSITCLLLLCAKAVEVGKEGSNSMTGEESCVFKATREQMEHKECVEGQNRKSSKRAKEHCIGKVILGSTVRVPEGQIQWWAMMQKPRTAVSMWHKLR